MVAPWVYASVDDEPVAHDALRVLLRSHPDFVDGGRFLQPVQALEVLSRDPVDLVFIDARMPAMSGLEWLRAWKPGGIGVLLTAYAEYAMLAYEAGVREYLLKPIAQGTLDDTLGRLRPLLSLKRAQGGGPTAMPLAFADGPGHRLVVPSAIIAVDADASSDAARLILSGESIRVSEGIATLEQRLTLFGFVRIHKRHLVNRAHLTGVSGDEVTLSHRMVRPVARAYRDAVEALARRPSA